MQTMIKKVRKWESDPPETDHFVTLSLCHFYFRSYHIYVLCLLMLVACKKEYPEPKPPAKAEFTFNWTIGNDAVRLEAGKDDYYMFTSYALDANGVYEYSGEFRNKNCNASCANSLKISIKDYRKTGSAPTSMDTTFEPALYQLATPAGRPSTFDVAFTDSLFNSTAQSYAWHFGDGKTSDMRNPVHRYRHAGVYSVAATAFSAGCSSTLSNSIVVGPAENAFQPELRMKGTTGNTIAFAYIPNGIMPVNFIMDFGDGEILVNPISDFHNYSASGVYTVKLTVTDATGYTAATRLNAATDTWADCYSNFYTTLKTPIPNVDNLSNVTVEWRDGSGNL
jgi:PKD repeat protein